MQPGGGHRGEDAQAAAGHAEDGPVDRRRGVQRVQRRPVAADGEHEVARRDVAGIGDHALLAAGANLDDLGVGAASVNHIAD